MSQSATAQTAILNRDTSERKHRHRLLAGWIVALAFVTVFTVYGFDYYTLSSNERPFSPKHALLRPSGTIGVNLGVFGVLLFFPDLSLPACASAGPGWASREIPATGWIFT
jgi:hypothetical protein